ncbi:long-chain fatty acid--CoA ligase [Deinococcus pimensis]|uniref:long-chain fatty acid--CoA ligase n=1 Tax=Deinococcus pimensis TaxID=309888 RepID=UPI00048167DE|nr:long-chain fatty acid--CoA ligase [Deinococcus pimensis]
MRSTMMDVPLTLPYVLERVQRYFPHGTVTSLLAAGMDAEGRPIPAKHRYTYADMARRAKQLANALVEAGVRPGDRVATIATNSYRHLEAYFAIPCVGAVLHTVNIRLHPEQIVYIVNHAGDKVLLIDNVLARLLPAILPHCPTLEKVVIMGPVPQQIPGALDYDTWISGQPDTFTYPEIDERAAAGMCYTSGTTGNPKGVVYSHRSIVLHNLGMTHPSGFMIAEGDTVLPVVPMFHVMAWGMPWAVPMVGANSVFASVFSDGPNLARLLAEEKVTVTAGVPTIWMGLLAEIERAREAGEPYDLSGLRELVVGGSAAPEALIRAFDRHGLRIVHAWGMTETSPFGTVSRLPAGVPHDSDEGYRVRAKQGRVPPLVDVRVIDDENRDVPSDGRSMGRLVIRGNWISGGYYGDETASRNSLVELRGPFGTEQWFDTGDIATIDEAGYISIQDRAKDLVKSGGEWISSVDLENALMGHPAVAQAAVIAVPHPKWDERPLAVVVLREGAQATPEDLRAHLEPRFARWWLPDAYEFVESIPIGSTGKFMKRELRDRFRDYRLESADSPA